MDTRKRVLITGAAGLVGGVLREGLADSYTLSTLDIKHLAGDDLESGRGRPDPLPSVRDVLFRAGRQGQNRATGWQLNGVGVIGWACDVARGVNPLGEQQRRLGHLRHYRRK